MNNAWVVYEQGSTLGTRGSEEGTIIRDEDYDNESHITLEENARAIPFAITCWIRNWLVHTRYFGDRIVAQQSYEEMKQELARIVELIRNLDDPEVGPLLDEFVKRFP